MGKIGEKTTNVNEVSKRNNVKNVNVKSRTLRAQRIAKALVDKFHDYNSYNFFLKCAWHMSEDEIWSSYERANSNGVKSPVRYFVTICKATIESR